jgi:hypothetical protein
MKIIVNKTRVPSFCRKTKWRGFDFRLVASSITRTECVRESGGAYKNKASFSPTGRYNFLSGFRTVGVNSDCDFRLFFIAQPSDATLHFSQLEYGSFEWNSFNSDARKLGRIQWKFVYLGCRRFSSH